MFKISLKKLLLLLPILGIALCIFFWQNILTFGLERYINHYCCHNLDGAFLSKSIHSDKEGWIIEKPEIVSNKELRDGGHFLKADRMVVKYQIHFWERKINLDLSIVNPNLNFKQTATDVRAIVNDLFPPTQWLTIHSKISVTQGSVALHDFKQNPPTKQTIYFQLDAECGANNTGALTVSLDDPTLKSNCIVLSLASLEQRHMALDFNFDGVKFSSLLGALRNVFPDLQDFTAYEGTIKGKMSLKVPQAGRPIAVGNLAVQDLSFSIPKLEMKGFVKEAYLHLSENFSRGQSENDTKTTKTAGHFELAKEVSISLEREGKPYCQITDLIGAVYFNTQESAHVVMDGRCNHHGQTSNLHLAGDARFGNDLQGDLDLSLRLTSPDKQDASVRFMTRALESKFKFAEISIANIGPYEFDLFKTVLTPYISEMRHVHLNSGSIDASILAYLRGLRMSDLKIEKIAARDLQFHISPWELSLDVGDLSGDLSVNLDSDVVLNTLNADLIVSDG